MINCLDIQDTVYTDSNQNFDSKLFESKFKYLKTQKQNLDECVDSLARSLKNFLQNRIIFKTEVDLFEENIKKAGSKIEISFDSNETKNLRTDCFEVI